LKALREPRGSLHELPREDRPLHFAGTEVARQLLCRLDRIDAPRFSSVCLTCLISASCSVTRGMIPATSALRLSSSAHSDK
jgi:hypothetical protein